jgi:hypothetical protein
MVSTTSCCGGDVFPSPAARRMRAQPPGVMRSRLPTPTREATFILSKLPTTFLLWPIRADFLYSDQLHPHPWRIQWSGHSSARDSPPPSSTLLAWCQLVPVLRLPVSHFAWAHSYPFLLCFFAWFISVLNLSPVDTSATVPVGQKYKSLKSNRTNVQRQKVPF